MEYRVTDGELPDACKISTPGHYEFQILDTGNEQVWSFQVDVLPDSGESISIAELYQISQLISTLTCDPENFDASLLGSNGAEDGQVLTADGSGGTTWEFIVGEGTGDMLKSIYDTDDDGVVEHADLADLATLAEDATLFGGLTPDDYQPVLPDGTTDGQLLVWDDTTAAWVPHDSIYADGSGYVHASGVVLDGPVFNSVFVMDQVYYLIDGESVVLVTREEAVEVRLPDPVLNNGRIVQIKKASSDGEVVTISSAGGGTVEGAATYELNYQYEAVTMIAANDAWFIF
jgi:hypothetical protein